jgi:ribosomal protein L12E/L44/L45/RPP1/RPP2
MTATAERVLEEIKSLPPADLREVCQAVLQLAGQISPAPSSSPAASAVPTAEEEDDDANEAAFFAALEELRQCGTIRLDAPGLED